LKWIPFFLLAALTFPLARRLRVDPRFRLWVFTALGVSPYLIEALHLNMAILDWRWIGYTHGLEFSVLDFIAVATYMAFSRTPYSFPFKISMGCYLVVTIVSAVTPQYPVTALFYSWQIARMIFLAAALYKAIRTDPEVAFAILRGLAFGILLECGVAIVQRLQGVTQTPGTYIHQNTLGIVSHFTMFPVFLLYLGGRRGWFLPATLTATVLITILTASRGTLITAIVGLGIAYLLSSLKKFTPRKSQVLLIGVAAMAVLVPLAASSLGARFAKQDSSIGALEEDMERLRYKKAASMMLSDHPMGVGANNFTYAANRLGYFDAVGEMYFQGRSGNVHNVYWLVAAETGYLGVITFVIFLFAPLRLALVSGTRHVGKPKGDLVLGMGVTLITVYLQSWEEWVFVTYEIQYLFALAVGIIAGLANDLDKRPR
jgi:O-antigen ligase